MEITVGYDVCLLSWQSVVGEKARGQTLVTTATERAECLSTTTSSQGRENIRSAVKKLRERWEDYVDRLTELDRNIEQRLSRWNSFNEQLRETDSWLKETEVKTSIHGPNDSLQNKKDGLQTLKVRHDCPEKVILTVLILLFYRICIAPTMVKKQKL